MKLVTISAALLEKFCDDSEVLLKSQRPYVLIIRLKYKEKFHDFAVPIRSNIPAATPKRQYFALPPRPTTRPHNRHGLHYIKMFPVTKQYLIRYRTEGNTFAIMLQNIIEKNSKQIIAECQAYLDDYAAGIHPVYSTNIDYLLSKLYDSPSHIHCSDSISLNQSALIHFSTEKPKTESDTSHLRQNKPPEAPKSLPKQPHQQKP